MKPVQLAARNELHFRSGDQGAFLPTPAAPGNDFASTLGDAVDRVDAIQKAANDQIASFVAGENENLHEVMIALNEAELTFQLMTEVRNRMLDTYHELMRMQV